jgi:cardiolipin synthase
MSCSTRVHEKAQHIIPASSKAWMASALLILLTSVGLTGCQKTEFSVPVPELGVSGSVFGGQNPVSGSLFQLYSVGTTGDGSAATGLISATVTTSDGTGLHNGNANAGNANNALPAGSFTITGDYSCPSATAEVYLVATGGNPGLVAGNNNPNLTLTAALGPCGDLSSSTYIAMNELTTMGMAAALSNFMNSYVNVGSSSGDASQLQTAFLTANQYANTASGTVPGATLPTYFSASSVALQTLADIIAACVNTTGGVAGDSSVCGQLFTLATPSGASVPADTVTAMLGILKQPSINATQLYALVPSTPPFLPTLPSAPASWALPISSISTAPPLTYKLYVFPETDSSVTPLYTFINSATSTIDMTMYEMQDTTFTADLVAACNRGVRVRVIFSSSIASSSATAYSALNSAGSNCSAVDSNSHFVNTHQKTITIDGALPTTQTAIMSLNLQTQYYSTTRDYAIIENDPVDIAAIEATFNQDYAAGGTNSLTEYNYQPGAGDDLIWSPTTAQPAMLAIINNAQKTLLIENEEMGASNIVSALVAACTRGVKVNIAMEYSSSYVSNFNSLKAAGCKLSTYNNPNGFYIHAKAVIADYGLPTQNVYMGSINYSNASMTENRELGVYLADPASVQLLNVTMTSDYSGGSPY